MFKSYFTMAWRSLAKNKTSSIINIGGLAIGLAAGILILLLITDEFSFDKFHTNIADIYQVMKNQENADGISTGDATAGPTAAMLRNEMPETKYAARVAFFGGELVRVGDKTLYESGIYADPDLFNMMSFRSLSGDPATILQDASSIAVTVSTAKQLFGSVDVIGKTIIFRDSNVFKVGAVMQDIPFVSSIRFDMVLPFRFFEKDNHWLTKWDDNRINTWVQLKPGANIPAFNNKLTKVLQERSDDKTVGLFVYPLADKRLYQHFVNGKPSGGRIYMVEIMSLLGLFILLIACINFMNLATARSEYRGREVGVRKVLGASRKSIILQFLSEALLLTFIALLVAVILALLVLPYFNQVTEKDIHFDFLSSRLWLLLAGIGLFTGIIAGSYPSIFLSRFKPVKVLKSLRIAGKRSGGLRRALVTFQFIISILFIIGTFVIFSQVKYIRERPIGYDQENLIDISAPGNLGNNFKIFENELEKMPAVKSVSAGSDNMLQFGAAVTGMDWPGKIPGHELSIIVTSVGYDWTKTTGLKLAAGRDFDRAFGTDSSACLINEAAVQKMGLKEPIIGSKIGGNTVIGVVQNFVYNNPSGIIAPMAIYLSTGRLNHFFVRIKNDVHWRETIGNIEAVAKKLNPAYPFEFHFTKEIYQHRFEEFASFGFLASTFGSIAIFISCLGLFGLSAFLAEKRSKEMSIRKVLGASLQNIWFMLSRDFLKPVLIAFIIALPIAIWALRSILSNIPYHAELNWLSFALAGLIAVFIALITVSYQGIKTALENPVTKLRNE